MRTLTVLAATTLALAVGGCGGPHPDQAVDLSGDLSKADVARYEREAQAADAHGHHTAMATLEDTNLWPLGLVAFWHRGTVMRTVGASGAPSYHVTRSLGLGPIALLYAGQTSSTYDAQGRRLSTSSVGSVALGHLAMFHDSDTVLADGQRQTMTSMHLLHHFLGIHVMDGHTAVSLFTAPNPVGVDFHTGH